MYQNISTSNNYPEIQQQIIYHCVNEDSSEQKKDCDNLQQVQENSNFSEMGYNFFQLQQFYEEVLQNPNEYQETDLSILKNQIEKLKHQQDYPQPVQFILEIKDVQMYIKQLLLFLHQQNKEIDNSSERQNENMKNTQHIREIAIVNIKNQNISPLNNESILSEYTPQLNYELKEGELNDQYEETNKNQIQQQQIDTPYIEAKNNCRNFCNRCNIS